MSKLTEKFSKLFRKKISRYNINGKNNKIIVVKPNNTEKVLDLSKEIFPGLFIEIYGDNNIIKILEPFVCMGTKITIGKQNLPNNGACITLGRSLLFTNNTILVNYGENQIINIAKNVTMYSCGMSVVENAVLEIGEGCMFANTITIRCGDGHTIFDNETGEILNNYTYTTKIGKHCWIGKGATILKKANIPDNSIIAEGAIVTKDFSKEPVICNNLGIPGGIVLAGAPAQIKKTGVNWSIKTPKYFIENNINPLEELGAEN